MVYTIDICGVECRRDEETKYYYVNEFIRRFNFTYKTNFMTFEEFTESDYYKAIEEEQKQNLSDMWFETDDEDILNCNILADIDMVYMYLYSMLYDKKFDNELAEYLESYGYNKSKCLIFN